MKAFALKRAAAAQQGFMLVAVMAIVTVLLATSAAFMRWSTDEQWQARHAAAAMQAYYMAQLGVVEKGFDWLRNQPASALPLGLVALEGNRGEYPNMWHERVFIKNLQQETEGSFWAEQRRFEISTVGVVRIPMVRNGRSDYKEVRRKAVLYVEVRNFADYMYLSNEEMTRFGDRIKFWGGDTLNGRVHSNSQIAIMQNPYFAEVVSTTADDFWRGAAYNPTFVYPPIFRAPRVEFPEIADLLRRGAAEQGNFYSMPGKQYRAHFQGRSVTVYRWDAGTPFDPRDSWSIQIRETGTGFCPMGTCIFFDQAPCEVYGVVEGRVTIGAAHNLMLIDDIRYVDANPMTGITPITSRNYLGLVSERDVKIANTPANGRENSGGLGRNQTNRALTSIVITGAIVALGESFTFENQNDPDSGYVCTCQPDDRGTIYLYGSITQRRRGYVHRSTRGSTGYLKQYRYDPRLRLCRPPCFFDVTDDYGRALFNIVQWGQGVESPAEIRNWNLVRYN